VLLAKHYNSHQQYEKALSITGTYYKSHPHDFIIGSLHAQNLILNKKYKEADALLKTVKILPHEGATNGREMYREAKLMQAVQLMERKNFKGALKFIGEARLWPENLGVGKPYDEDIDTRLEDWMDYLCARKMRNNVEADKLLNRIVSFQPVIDNTVRNFTPANTLVTAWAFERMNQKNKAASFIDTQIRNYPKYKNLLWSKAMYEKDNNYVLPEIEKDANVRIIEKLISSGM
jgi:hypothetical protein